MTGPEVATVQELERLRRENDRLKETIRARAQFIDTLSQLKDAIENPPSDVEVMGIMEMVLENTIWALDAKDASLLVLDDKTDELVLALAEGDIAKDKLLWQRVPPGAGIAGWCVQNRSAAIVNDARSDTRFYSRLDKDLQFHTKTVLAAPLVCGGQVLGVIEVLNKRDAMLFDYRDRARLTLVCHFAAQLLSSMLTNIEHTGSGRAAAAG